MQNYTKLIFLLLIYLVSSAYVYPHEIKQSLRIEHVLGIFLNGLKATEPNQCEVSYVHVGYSSLMSSGTFTAKFITLDGDVNSNWEILDGAGLTTDSTRETMSSAQQLDRVEFIPSSDDSYMPCIVAITIVCGKQVVTNGEYTSIGYQDMLNAWYRVESPRDIDKQQMDDVTCVTFDQTGKTNSFKGMTVHAAALKCENNRDCIQRSIQMW